MNKTILSQISMKTVAKISGGGLGLAYLSMPEVTTYGLAGVTASGIVWSGYWVTTWLIEIPHRWKWITPLHRALAGPLNIDPDMSPRKYIKIPRDYMGREKVGKVVLPKEFTGLDKNSSATVIREKLGLSEASVTYKLAGRNPHLVITQPPRPPKVVRFSDDVYREMVETMSESSPLIGIGPNNRKVSVSLDSDSPHILMNAGTGGGKSVTTRTMCSQMLHNGAQMMVLDVKEHSQMWADGLPNVVYCRDIGQIHDALVRLGPELSRRNKIVVDAGIEDDNPDVGPRLIILVEEINGTTKDLRRHWAEIRSKEDPKVSPAVDALHKTLFMGRAVRMNVLTAAQYATAAALGGPEARENFGTRILARSTNNAWKMLAPEVQPIPRAPRVPGRVHVAIGGQATETQVLFMSDAEARQWAVSGTVTPISDLLVPLSQGPSTMADQGGWAGTVPGRHLAAVPDAPVAPRLVTLRQAVDQGLVDCSLDSLRAYRKRDSRFPPHVEKRGQDLLYRPEDLSLWYVSRSA